jgi:hypothetical protein
VDAIYFKVDPVTGKFHSNLAFFAPYIAVIISESVVEEGLRDSLSEIFARSGCRAMSASGPDASQWDDSVDWAVLEQADFNGVNYDNTIMTSFSNSSPINEFIKNAVFLFTDPDINHRSLAIFDFRMGDNFEEVQIAASLIGLDLKKELEDFQ